MTKSLSLAILTAAVGATLHTQRVDVTRNGSQPAVNGSDVNFTGHVVVQPLFGATEHTRASAGQVTFAPGARSAWHSHLAGQHLIVTSGVGWVQAWGGEKQEIRPGDVVWTPPGVKHWHGATFTNGMTHIAMQEQVNGKNVDWMEHVTETQYAK